MRTVCVSDFAVALDHRQPIIDIAVAFGDITDGCHKGIFGRFQSESTIDRGGELMARLLEGKVAIITGSGRGIGREEALLMAKHGC